MSYGLWILAVLFIPLPGAWGADAAPNSVPKPFSANFIGEGGGSSHLSGSAGDFIEHDPRQRTGQGTFGPIGRRENPAGDQAPPPHAVTSPAPKRNLPQRRADLSGRPLPRLPAPALPMGVKASKSDAPAPAAQDSDPRRYSLWEGLAAPLDLPADKVRDMAPDQASQLVRRDYDTHILAAGGSRQSRAASGDAFPIGGAAAAPVGGLIAPETAREERTGGEVFVALDLDLGNRRAASGSSQSRSASGDALPIGAALKDAIADLSRVAGFRQDPRFEPAPADWAPQRLSIWGWMPAERLGEAMRLPSVSRLEVRHGASKFTSLGAASEMLIGVRVPPRGSAEESAGNPLDEARLGDIFARVNRELAVQAGFRWKKTVGYQSVPGSRDLALIVLGEVPVKNLARLMAHPEVLKIMPAPAAVPEPPPSVRIPSRTPLGRFFSHALSRSPLLLLSAVLLTFALLALLPLGGGLGGRLAQIFVPYH